MKVQKEDRLQELIGELKTKTLDPALKAAEQVKKDAQSFADQLIAQAQAQKEQILQETQREVEQKHKAFQSSLKNAKRQAVDALRQEIETGIFNPEIRSVIDDEANETKLVRQAIEVMIHAAGNEGDFKAYVSEKIKPEDVAKGFTKTLLKQIDGKVYPLKSLRGGAQLRVEKGSMTLDLSSEAIANLLSTYMRLEFRKLVFGEEA